MIKFHFYDMDFGLDEDPAADLAAHRELLKEAEKRLRWAEHDGDHRRAISLHQEIAYRQAEIARLTAFRFPTSSRGAVWMKKVKVTVAPITADFDEKLYGEAEVARLKEKREPEQLVLFGKEAEANEL